MRYSCLIVFCFCFFFSSVVHAAYFKPTLDIYTVKTDHFYIHYPKEAASVAEDAAEIAERVHANLSEKLKWKPWGRTHMVLVDRTDQANGLATVLPANYMVLYITPPTADSSLDNYKNYLELLITHEYTHILHIDQHNRWSDPPHWVLGKIIAPNGLTPGWMREGIAAWKETVETGRGRGNSSYSDMMLRASIYDDTFPGIDQASGNGISWPGNNYQYIYGVRFWQWLAEKYGEESITRYMEEYASGLWLFSLNNKARRVFNKSFYQLWKEWKEELQIEYAQTKLDLTDKGLTPFQDLVKNKNQLSYPILHPSGTGYAYMEESLDESSRIVIQTGEGKEPTFIKRALFGQMSFSSDGKKLAYASLSGVESFNAYSEVFVYDLETKKTNRVHEKGKTKKSMRASDPDFAPFDGGNRWLVMVRTELGTDNLYVYDLEAKKGYYLTNSSEYTQFSNPRFSPDGEKIVVSRKDHEGNRDIVLYDKRGNEIKKITNDEANDNYPVWSPGGGSIYFASDSSGISNIYQLDLASGTKNQVTNVLTGVFHPQLSKDGKTLYVSYYTSQGTHLAVTNLNGSSFANVPNFSNFEAPKLSSSNASKLPSSYAHHLSKSEEPELVYPKSKKVEETETKEVPPSEYAPFVEDKLPPVREEVSLPGAKKYHAFPQVLVPRYLVPTFSTLDEGFLFGFATGRFDPLYRHNWNAYANYRTDAAFTGGGASYAYTRYQPTFYIGGIRYALNWGDIFAIGEDFFEQRMQGYAGASLGIPHHAFSLTYFYEDRDNLSDIPAGFALANLDRYAGFRTQYLYSRTKAYPHSISQENGPYLKLGFDITDEIFGAADVNEQQIFTGDFRYYFEMPWSDHHVFGLRAAGGFAWGDAQFAGTFRFGGPFGEGNLAGYSDRLFPLRGLPGITFSGDRVMLFSAEYRLPIAKIERGLGTWPVFFNKVHMSFFGDYGDSWFNDGKVGRGFFEDFFLGVGVELKSDMVIGYGLPVTARLGYAIIVLNRDQIAGLEDSLTGMDLQNGTAYFQFGTAF